MNKEPIIRLENVTKRYRVGDQDVHALRGVSFDIFPGEMVALVGASGSGKSTLLNLIGCLDKPTSGSYGLLGQDVGSLSENARAGLRNQALGFVFQNYNLLGRTNALKNVELPMVYCGLPRAERRKRATELLELVGLTDRQNHEPTQLSGGQQQRVTIARALVNGPQLILADEPTGNLDSQTGQEILGLFRKLNRERGITLILVTHDLEVASQMDRVIRVKDGLIEEDTTLNEDTPALEETPSRTSQPGKGHARSGVFSNVSTALGALRVNKMRALLTILGVIIGVATVIAMRATGQGAQDSIAGILERLGTNRVTVYPGSFRGAGRSGGAASLVTLTPGDAEAIRDEVPGLRAVAPLVRGGVQVISGNKNWLTRAYGTTGDYLGIMNITLESGSNLRSEDIQRTKKVVVLGRTPARELFGSEDPVGKVMRIKHIPFEVIGVLEERGSVYGTDLDDLLIVPYTTAQKRLLGVRHLHGIEVGAETDHSTAVVEEDIKKLLRDRHRLREEKRDDFRIRNASVIVKAATQAIRIFSFMLAIIALISLGVGGIGIMNIMLVSVTERTREIGIRLALGARRRDIRAQFLTEAIILSLLGGVLGVVLGLSISVLITALGGIKTGYLGTIYTPVSVDTILMACGFAVTVGVFFGFHPASKAAKLNPIEALRYE